MMYNRIVEDCFFLPRHVGVLDNTLPHTVSACSTYPIRGSGISMSMRCDIERTICNMCFKSNGNPYLIAALEYLCRQCVGEKLEQLDFKEEKLIKILEIPFNQRPLLAQVEMVYKEIIKLMNSKLEGES